MSLEGYEHILTFYPNFSSASQQEMDEFITVHQMEYDYSGQYEMVSCDKFFVIVFVDGNHERDSSNDHYLVYRRRMSFVI